MKSVRNVISTIRKRMGKFKKSKKPKEYVPFAELHYPYETLIHPQKLFPIDEEDD